MSTADSDCDDAAGLSKSSIIWTHVTAIADSDLNPQAQMVVCHNGTTAMAFHAISRAGLVCTKCFKLYTQGSFAKHAQGCDDALPPPEAVTKKWKDTASLWADLLGPSPSITALLQRTRSGLQNVINSWHIFSTLVGLQERGKSRHFVSQMGVIQCAQSMH